MIVDSGETEGDRGRSAPGRGSVPPLTRGRSPAGSVKPNRRSQRRATRRSAFRSRAGCMPLRIGCQKDSARNIRPLLPRPRRNKCRELLVVNESGRAASRGDCRTRRIRGEPCGRGRVACGIRDRAARPVVYPDCGQSRRESGLDCRAVLVCGEHRCRGEPLGITE